MAKKRQAAEGTAAESTKPRKASPNATFRNFDPLLIDRVNMKAAARGTGQAEYLIELFQRETKDYVELQKKARAERASELAESNPEQES